MARTVIVVPCYNEAGRLDSAAFRRFAGASGDVDFLFVDDGSRDATPQRLAELERDEAGRFRALVLERNRGKAEAVRAGVLAALDAGADFVGYWDADLATPLCEIPAMLDVLAERPEVEVVFGARVKLLGRSIRRRVWRHYAGRVFATFASEMLRLGVYDTQCGAKIFRNGSGLRPLFAEPFVSRWIFDVELIARMIARTPADERERVAASIYEYPLRRWHDVAGSKIGPLDFVRAFVELFAIWRRYLRAR